MIFEKIYNILLLINLFIIIINYKVLGKHNIQALTYDHPYQFEEIADLRSSITEINPKNSIRNDIRRAFEPMRVKEELLDYMVELMCKRISEDPVYTFKMPLSQYKYKNLIMHRSDFEIPVYPNLTETHIQMAKLSKRVDLNVMPIPSAVNSGWLQKYTPNIINKNFNNYNEDDDENINSNSDDELLQNEIVKTNTVTETNFINYVLKINDKGEKYLKKEKSKNNNLKNSNHNYYTTFKTTKPPTGKFYQNQFGEPKIKYMKNYLSDPKIDWSEFGVNIEEYYEPKYKYSSTYNQNSEVDSYESKNFQHSTYDIQMPGDYGFFDKTEKNSVWDLPGKLSSIPLRLEDKYLMNTNDILRNMTILLTKESRPRWPLTAKKDSHKDLDIYIARSNDPFGHSTKWQIRNQTNPKTAIDFRKKRGIKELYSMIKCSTGCDPLIYKGYGCFCGFMGSGIPVDGIDRCCKIHDDCYTQSNCPSYLEYFIPFLWKCYRGKPLCASSHGEWGGPRSCAAQLCQCDLNLAKCLRKFQCPRKRAVCKSSYVRMIQNYLMVY